MIEQPSIDLSWTSHKHPPHPSPNRSSRNPAASRLSPDTLPSAGFLFLCLFLLLPLRAKSQLEIITEEVETNVEVCLTNCFSENPIFGPTSRTYLSLRKPEGSSIRIETSTDLNTWRHELSGWNQSSYFNSTHYSMESSIFFRVQTPALAPDELRSVWETRMPRTYQFRFRRIQLASPQNVMQGVIRVDQDNKQIFDRMLQGEAERDPPDPPEYLTIEDLFDLLEASIASPALSIEVKYDTPLGYPRRITIIHSDKGLAPSERWPSTGVWIYFAEEMTLLPPD